MTTPVILVVDANEGTRDAITDLLHCGGFRAFGVAGTTAALEVTARLRPSLVLLDCFSPSCDGLETLALMRALPSTRDLPVVVYGAGPTDGVRERAIKLGAAEFIGKDEESWPRLLDRVGHHLAVTASEGGCETTDGEGYWTR